ncbi:nucleoside triphosphate pyrophosphohydrolase family protein [Nocardia otitidiscaviarum]|uniref:nucleoside triphosphate pyrophosphohydrolase family protein n=1 Tax=Nocardia otitidiscaviarum TaxID=1823 RepID=UPI002457C68C|nr:nucleoside triphosphate pyrophosphohydrolase family protein [Nocardia otitidiscaviarum]
MSIYRDVAVFNRACGVALRDEPGWPRSEDLTLALRLINEEVDELRAALEARDMIAAADGIADTLYVTAGLALRVGVANRLEGQTPVLRDVNWPPSWDTYQREAPHSWPYRLDLYRNRLTAAAEGQDLRLTTAYIDLLISATAALGALLHLPMASVWATVQFSNMSKVVDGQVLRRADGKIQKPPTFTPPDIAGVLASWGWKAAA